MSSLEEIVRAFKEEARKFPDEIEGTDRSTVEIFRHNKLQFVFTELDRFVVGLKVKMDDETMRKDLLIGLIEQCRKNLKAEIASINAQWK